MWICLDFKAIKDKVSKKPEEYRNIEEIAQIRNFINVTRRTIFQNFLETLR